MQAGTVHFNRDLLCYWYSPYHVWSKTREHISNYDLYVGKCLLIKKNIYKCPQALHFFYILHLCIHTVNAQTKPCIRRCNECVLVVFNFARHSNTYLVLIPAIRYPHYVHITHLITFLKFATSSLNEALTISTTSILFNCKLARRFNIVMHFMNIQINMNMKNKI